MKISALLCLLIAMISCKEEKAENELASAPNPSFDYLVGNWARTNDEPGQKTFESWTKKNDTVYKAIGYTLRENDTIWLENVVLSKTGKDWNFSVTPKGSAKATPFKLTAIGSDGFTCNNDKNDFPKQIKYYVTSDEIHAVISGEGNPDVSFEFDRIR